MKSAYAIIYTLLLLIPYSLVSQEPMAVQVNLRDDSKNASGIPDVDCVRVVHVESPAADTYTSVKADTINFGKEISMRLRGAPVKKSMISHLSFRIGSQDPAIISHAYLKVYTVSKHSDSNLSVFGSKSGIDETVTTWSNQPQASRLLGSEILGEKPYHEFEVTDFLISQLHQGEVHFTLQTDSKKPIEISSRESGLGSELIIEYCDRESEMDIYGAKPQGKYGMQILPNPQNGKFTIELTGVPAGGFGDLMIMDEQGGILRQFPMAIRKGRILRHSVDYGDLRPGIYWAVFRKGRVMVRDQFRLQPSKDQDKLLEVSLEEPSEIEN